MWGRVGRPESFLTLRQVGLLKGHAKTKMLELLSRAEAAKASLEKARTTAVLCQAMLCLGLKAGGRGTKENGRSSKSCGCYPLAETGAKLGKGS